MAGGPAFRRRRELCAMPPLAELDPADHAEPKAAFPGFRQSQWTHCASLTVSICSGKIMPRGET
jgi:hypothetical protein